MADYRKYFQGLNLEATGASPIAVTKLFNSRTSATTDIRVKSLWLKFVVLLNSNTTDGNSAGGFVAIVKHDSYKETTDADDAADAKLAFSNYESPALLGTKPWVASEQSPDRPEIYFKGITLQRGEHLYVGIRRMALVGNGNTTVRAACMVKCVVDNE